MLAREMLNFIYDLEKKTGRYEKFRIRCRTCVMGKWSISKHKFQTFVIEIYDDCNFLCIKKRNFKIENYFLNGIDSNEQ